MERFEHQLYVNAEDFDDRTAIADGLQSVSYRELWTRIESRAAQLGELDGRAMVFRAAPSVDFATEYFAIHRAGGIAVPVDRNCPSELFERLSGQAEKAQLPADTADVLFTTGTTGSAKGVVVSHTAILASVRNLISAQGYDHRQRMIIHGPLNHIGSLSKLWTALYVGAEVVLMDGLKDLSAFFGYIEQSPWRATTFLVPTQIQMLLRFCTTELQKCAKNIDFIETGAAPIALADMQALRRALPSTRLYNTYASTETGIVCTYDYQQGECLEGCLGRPEWDTTVSVDESGHVVVQGPTLMSGYLADDGTLSDRPQNATLRTADLGRIDPEGRLRLQGREDDVINVGGFKVSPEEVENAAMGLPGLADCICIATRHKVLGTQLKLLYVAKNADSIEKSALIGWFKERLEPHKIPTLYERVESIARTFNGKRDRKRYRED